MQTCHKLRLWIYIPLILTQLQDVYKWTEVKKSGNDQQVSLYQKSTGNKSTVHTSLNTSISTIRQAYIINKWLLLSIKLNRILRLLCKRFIV